MYSEYASSLNPALRKLILQMGHIFSEGICMLSTEEPGEVHAERIECVIVYLHSCLWDLEASQYVQSPFVL